MTKPNQKALNGHDDLVIVLRRMTNRALREMSNELGGERDFTDSASAFYFSNRTIAAEVGIKSKDVAEVILESGLDYVHKNGEILVWLDDLDERLEHYANAA
ncbi:hypothetical protein [Vibrio parahaemolyticus]|uniref:hypothetical protein n=1 Tax=Vibrio parahaemolyticus TaxID=670 RepID=UPI003D81A6EC